MLMKNIEILSVNWLKRYYKSFSKGTWKSGFYCLKLHWSSGLWMKKILFSDFGVKINKGFWIELL